MRRFTVIVMAWGLCCGFCGAEEGVFQRAAVGAEEAGYFDRPCSAVATDHFTVIHDMRAEDGEAIARVLEFAYQQFGSRFSGYGFAVHALEAPLVWLCFRKPESFQDYGLATENADLSWLSGYYSSRTNRVAVVRPGRIRTWQRPAKPVAGVAARVEDGVDAGLVKIMHEAGHQLAFNTGLLKRGVMYPLWATEGVALVFEDCASNYAPGGRYSEARMKRLVALYREEKLMPLDGFVILASLPPDAVDADIYAEAWGLFLFLCEKRPTELRDYLSYLYSLKSGRRSAYHLRREFVESFGPVGEVQREWRLFIELSATNRPFSCGPSEPKSGAEAGWPHSVPAAQP